jgi:hypothetical protein
MPDPDMNRIADAAFWRLIVTLAAFLLCLSPLLAGVRP